MNIQELEKRYAKSAHVSALAQAIGKSTVKTIFLEEEGFTELFNVSAICSDEDRD